jgi:hypothetical protein
MSDGELSRLEVLRDLNHGRLTTAAAGQLLGRLGEPGVPVHWAFADEPAGQLTTFRELRMMGSVGG